MLLCIYGKQSNYLHKQVAKAVEKMKEECKRVPLQSAVSRAVGRLGEYSGFYQLPTMSSLKQT